MGAVGVVRRRWPSKEPRTTGRLTKRKATEDATIFEAPKATPANKIFPLVNLTEKRDANKRQAEVENLVSACSFEDESTWSRNVVPRF